ncbi:P-loop containing nucleoside triphosphate hydrolase protein [Zopfochytrium polystomum]|nr:P-loop containing nucleoside triphosphate hydrolase protein [Zopfochytrium polystomum]
MATPPTPADACAAGAAAKAVVVVVMGVAGSGKSSVAAELARHAGAPFVEGDDLHPRTNTEKMARGEPLTDADRLPWLRDLRAAFIAASRASSSSRPCVFVSCSALRKQYRDVLRTEPPPVDDDDNNNTRVSARPVVDVAVRFLYLRVPPQVLHSRLESRTGHFMKPGMLASQLAVLEEPDPRDEPDVVVAQVVESMTREDVVRLLWGLLREVRVVEGEY